MARALLSAPAASVLKQECRTYHSTRAQSKDRCANGPGARAAKPTSQPRLACLSQTGATTLWLQSTIARRVPTIRVRQSKAAAGRPQNCTEAPANGYAALRLADPCHPRLRTNPAANNRTEATRRCLQFITVEAHYSSQRVVKPAYPKQNRIDEGAFCESRCSQIAGNNFSSAAER